MTGLPEDLRDHLATGTTTVCRAWVITRTDGVTFGFTDHDRDLSFEGLNFLANTGLSAAALVQSTGLSVDNTEAIGALNAASIREEDIEAGRFDRAEVKAWLVNWQDVSQRWLQFRGYLGEIRRGAGAFQAELRGLTDLLNQTTGRTYQKPCAAVLGDGNCRFDLSTPGFSTTVTIENVEDSRVFSWIDTGDVSPGWFARGRLEVLSGPGAGLWGSIKSDRTENGVRFVELWQPLHAEISVADTVRVIAGCDKRSETCRAKFANMRNFQGFPDIPGEDWLVAVPKSSGRNDGGSRR